MRIASVLAAFLFLSVCAAPGFCAGGRNRTGVKGEGAPAAQPTTRGGSGRCGMQFLGPDTIADVIEGAEPIKLSTTSPIKHPFIGIEMVEPDPAAAAMGMVPAAKGVQVSTVRPFRPASNAGLLPGDAISQIDGMAVSCPDDVSEAVARVSVARVSVGPVLKVDIRRGNAQKHLDVRVEALPDDG